MKKKDEIAAARILIKQELTRPALDRKGRVIRYKTLRNAGLKTTPLFAKVMAEEIELAGMEMSKQGNANNFDMSDTSCLPFGPMTSQFTWQSLKVAPVIYEIINTVNGKRFVASASNITKERLVKGFYINNPKSEHRSNPFTQCEDMLADIEKYGPDAFRLEVVKFLAKDIDINVRKLEARAYMESIPRYQRYNRVVMVLAKNPEWVAARNKWRELLASKDTIPYNQIENARELKNSIQELIYVERAPL
jgi:hypothetical protein